jgi:hypothetical protein
MQDHTIKIRGPLLISADVCSIKGAWKDADLCAELKINSVDFAMVKNLGSQEWNVAPHYYWSELDQVLEESELSEAELVQRIHDAVMQALHAGVKS